MQTFDEIYLLIQNKTPKHWCVFSTNTKLPLFELRNYFGVTPVHTHVVSNHTLLRHTGHDGVSNHQCHDCLLNCVFKRRSEKTSKLRITGLCARNSPVNSEFPAQMASNTSTVSIWWNHHVSGVVDNVTANTPLKNMEYSVCISSKSLSKFHKISISLIYIFLDKWHNLTKILVKLYRSRKCWK